MIEDSSNALASDFEDTRHKIRLYTNDECHIFSFLIWRTHEKVADFFMIRSLVLSAALNIWTFNMNYGTMGWQ